MDLSAYRLTPEVLTALACFTLTLEDDNALSQLERLFHCAAYTLFHLQGKDAHSAALTVAALNKPVISDEAKRELMELLNGIQFGGLTPCH